jgi:hypothetical protein
LLIVAFVCIVTSCLQSDESLPALNESYRKTDRQPFGSYIAYKEVKNLLDNRYIETVRDPFDKEWLNIKDYSDDKKYSLYILVTKNLVLTEAEITAFLDYVKSGNDLFISADYVDSKLLDNISCANERMAEIADETRGLMQQTRVSMYFGDGMTGTSYSYYYYPFLNSLSGFDTSFARVLGVNDHNMANYIVLFSGKGRIYLHVAPRVFSNYFLLSGQNYKYLEDVISYLRSDPKNIYWDEFYKNANLNRRTKNGDHVEDNFSSLSVIGQHPPLQWAFWLGAAGLLLFVITNVKRKQRVIEVDKPNINTTVNFTETVGRLYLQKKSNNHIAEKMITYFYEQIRNRYFISTSHINDEFINVLAGKSGVPKEQTQQLFTLIEQVQSVKNTDDATLLRLNNAIEFFNRNQS